jgi:hypothetical protein
MELISVNRIGLISLFPERSGLFFDDRINSEIENSSIFLEKHANFYINVNNLIANILAQSLEKKFKGRLEFIALPSISTYENVAGYMIEGIWGEETKSFNVRGLKKFFKIKILIRL